MGKVRCMFKAGRKKVNIHYYFRRLLQTATVMRRNKMQGRKTIQEATETVLFEMQWNTSREACKLYKIK